jgi:PhnB protein
MNIPETHQTVMPYLMLNNAAAFIDFAENVFDAKILFSVRDDNQKVSHAEIKIGDSTIMFSEATTQWPVQNANLFVYVENADETYVKAIKAGASILMEIDDKDYGRTCGVTDAFGNVWWITSII